MDINFLHFYGFIFFLQFLTRKKTPFRARMDRNKSPCNSSSTGGAVKFETDALRWSSLDEEAVGRSRSSPGLWCPCVLTFFSLVSSRKSNKSYVEAPRSDVAEPHSFFGTTEEASGIGDALLLVRPKFCCDPPIVMAESFRPPTLVDTFSLLLNESEKSPAFPWGEPLRSTPAEMFWSDDSRRTDET